MNVLYFGSDALSLRALTILRNHQTKSPGLIKQIKVVTPPDRVAGRGHSKVTSCALKNGAQIMGLETIDAPQVAPRPELSSWNGIMDLGKAEQMDIAVVFSFGYFMPKSLIEVFPMGAINIHPSLLPKYRGASPIQHALLNGDSETGVCVIEVHPEKFDSGNILARKVVQLDRTITYTPLSQQLADIGGNLVVDVLSDIPGCRSLAQPQQGAASRAPKLSTKEKFISDFRNPDQIFNKFRTFELVSCHLKMGTTQSVVTLFDVAPVTQLKTSLPSNVGDVILSRDRSQLFIRCGADQDNIWLPVGRLRLEGKGIVSANEFFNGYLLRRQKTEQGVVRDVFC